MPRRAEAGRILIPAASSFRLFLSWAALPQLGELELLRQAVPAAALALAVLVLERPGIVASALVQGSAWVASAPA
jgi:hypothetical protein